MEHDTYCHKCEREYSGVSNLRRHIKKFHPDIPPPYQEKKDYPFTCDVCGKNFSYMRNFKSHKKSHLPADQIVECSKAKIKKKCPICDFSDWDRRGMLHHFWEAHELNVLPEYKTFANFDEFLQWKKEFETDKKSLFIKRHEAGTARFESTIIYRCHRSGYYQPRGKNIRRLKTQGSCKIDGYCPATIKAMKQKNGVVQVMLYTTHVGHQEDVVPTASAKRDKEEVKLSNKLKSIRLRHTTSLTLQKDLIVKTNQGWLFPSSKSGEVYCITENDPNCKCELVCSLCKTCVHRYSCNCLDSSKKGNMCKHVHLLCFLLMEENNPAQQEQIDPDQYQQHDLKEQYHEVLHHELKPDHYPQDQLQTEQLQVHHSDDELIIYEGLHQEDEVDIAEIQDEHHIQNMLEERKRSILNKLNDVLQRCNDENLLREIEMYVIQLDARVECGVMTVPPLVPLANTPIAVAVPVVGSILNARDATSPTRQKTVLTELKQPKTIVKLQANDLFRHL